MGLIFETWRYVILPEHAIIAWQQIRISEYPCVSIVIICWVVMCEVKHEKIDKNDYIYIYIDSLVQDCSNSSALAMELLQSWTEPSIYICI